APGKATIEMFQGKGLRKIPTDGPLSIAIPGAVDGWVELHRKYGSLDLPRLAADAIGYARDGFPLYRRLAERIAELSSSFPSIDRSFRKPLGELRPGKMLLQRELAHTLEEVVKKGREGFYQGDVGERMCHAIQAEGGLLSEADLRKNFAEWLDPIRTTYRDYLLFEQPPVSQGFIVLEMLNIIEGYPLDEDKMGLVDVVHVMVEAKKLAFEDRINHLEDPRFGDPQISRLISKEHAHNRRSLISTNAKSRRHLSVGAGGDTTYLCAVDREGNVVSIIQSIFAPFGSGIVAGDTGVVMNNRLCSFGLDSNKANSLRPGKRPAHTLNSYMVFRDGDFFAVGGTPGTDDQPQCNVQILHNLLDRHMDPQAAVEAPRWSHIPGTPPRSELPEALRLEEGFSPELISGLREKGHEVKVVDRWSFGSSEVIVRDPMSGTWVAGADPRREGYAIGW
ncbi:MAG: gamma-glutamyltransferase family protein, partial [Candidatus Binatia bacterium]